MRVHSTVIPLIPRHVTPWMSLTAYFLKAISWACDKNGIIHCIQWAMSRCRDTINLICPYVCVNTLPHRDFRFKFRYFLTNVWTKFQLHFGCMLLSVGVEEKKYANVPTNLCSYSHYFDDNSSVKHSFVLKKGLEKHNYQVVCPCANTISFTWMNISLIIGMIYRTPKYFLKIHWMMNVQYEWLYSHYCVVIKI